MKRQFLILALVLMYLGSQAQNQQIIKEFETIDTLAFQSSSDHWYHIADKDNDINPSPNQPRYNSTQLKEIADNILLYQKDNGGWPKNYDMLAILTEDQKQILLKAKTNTNTTFDNSTTYSHVECLAKVYYVTKVEKYKNACRKGIDFILASQYANGGWPQYYPLKDDYSRYVTYNDDNFTNIMLTIKDITESKPQYSFLDKGSLEKVKTAYKKGLNCIMKTQINDKGILTAWCQQYDEKTLAPTWARKYEPIGICNKESSNLVLFLMDIDHPDKEIINSIQSAIKWFDLSKIEGIKVEKISAPEVTYKKISKTDRIVVKDSLAPPIWARFYELETHRPLFCNRDSKLVYSLAEVERERRDGYGWYTYDPKKALKSYKAWQQKWAPENDVLKK